MIRMRYYGFQQVVLDPLIKTDGPCVILHRNNDPWFANIFRSVTNSIKELFYDKKYLFIISIHDMWGEESQYNRFIPYIKKYKELGYKIILYNAEDLVRYLSLNDEITDDIKRYVDIISEIDVKKDYQKEYPPFKSSHYFDTWNNFYSVYAFTLYIHFCKSIGIDEWWDFGKENIDFIKKIVPNFNIPYKQFIPATKKEVKFENKDISKIAFIGSNTEDFVYDKKDFNYDVDIKLKINRRSKLLTGLECDVYDYKNPVDLYDVANNYSTILNIHSTAIRKIPEYIRIYDILYNGLLPVVEASLYDSYYSNSVVKFNESLSTDTSKVKKELKEVLEKLKDETYYGQELERCINSFNEENKKLVELYKDY